MAQLNITDKIADTLLRHDIDLMRIEAGTRAKVVSMLKGVTKELTSTLNRFDPTNKGAFIFRNKALKQVLASTAPMIDDAYAQISNVVEGDLADVAQLSKVANAAAINNAIGVEVASARLNKQVVTALARNTAVEGKIIKDWWSKQGKDLQDAFGNQVRDGILGGETIPDIVRRVRGTKAANFKDGIMATTTRKANALVRTSVLSVANEARFEMFQENQDVVKGTQWLSTLDSRTSNICMALSGETWNLDGSKRKGTKLPWRGPPPAHFQCRSTLIPLTRTFEELAKSPKIKEKLAELPDTQIGGLRSTMDGLKAGALNYEQWLRTKPEIFQLEILGPVKHRLWKSGKLAFTDLVDQSHNPLSTEALLAKVKQKSLVGNEPALPSARVIRAEANAAAQKKALDRAAVKKALEDEKRAAAAEAKASAALAAARKADPDSVVRTAYEQVFSTDAAAKGYVPANFLEMTSVEKLNVLTTRRIKVLEEAKKFIKDVQGASSSSVFGQAWVEFEDEVAKLILAGEDTFEFAGTSMIQQKTLQKKIKAITEAKTYVKEFSGTSPLARRVADELGMGNRDSPFPGFTSKKQKRLLEKGLKDAHAAKSAKQAADVQAAETISALKQGTAIEKKAVQDILKSESAQRLPITENLKAIQKEIALQKVKTQQYDMVQAYKKSVIAGKTPTVKQAAAFNKLDAAGQEKLIKAIEKKGGKVASVVDTDAQKAVNLKALYGNLSELDLPLSDVNAFKAMSTTDQGLFLKAYDIEVPKPKLTPPASIFSSKVEKKAANLAQTRANVNILKEKQPDFLSHQGMVDTFESLSPAQQAQVLTDFDIPLPKPKPLIDPSKPGALFESPPRPEVLTFSEKQYTKIGSQKGSNAGGLYQDTGTGEKLYMKFGLSEDTARNEVLASKLYQASGVDVADMRLLKTEEGWGVAGVWEDGLEASATRLQSATGAAQAGEGFATDAWLANWDSVGLEFDNLLYRASGKTVRIDVGGALRYRAQGGMKGSAFGKVVDEIDTMRDVSGANASASSVFSQMTKAELKLSAERVASVTEEMIDDLILEFGPRDPAVAQELAVTLKARRKDLLKRLGVKTPAKPKAAPVKKALTGEAEAKAVKDARSNGFSRNTDGGDIEDQAILFWEEAVESGSRVAATLKVRGKLAKQLTEGVADTDVWKLRGAREGLAVKKVEKGRLVVTSDALEMRGASSVNFFEANIDGVRVRYWTTDKRTAKALQGTVQIEVQEAGADGIQKALDALQKIGIPVERATIAEQERLYLMRIAESMNLRTSIITTTETLVKKISNKLGIEDVRALPTYKVQQQAKAFDQGRMTSLRPDLESVADLKWMEKNHFKHTSGDAVATFKSIINEGGVFASKSDFFRRGKDFSRFGLSPIEDMQRGGGNYLYTTPRRNADGGRRVKKEAFTWKGTAVRRTDQRTHPGDEYGRLPKAAGSKRIYAESGRLSRIAGQHETLFKDGLSLFEYDFELYLKDQDRVQKMIQWLKEQGEPFSQGLWPDGRRLTDVIRSTK